MPGPTTRGTYIGKTKAESITLARQRAASTLADDHPACRICSRPMVAGQAASNDGAHYTCTAQPSSSGAGLVKNDPLHAHLPGAEPSVLDAASSSQEPTS